MDLIIFALFVSLSINLVMFLPAYIYQTDKITDISYAVTFAIVAIAGYLASDKTVLHLIILLMVLLWSARLGTFLLIRINKIGKDSRFNGMREQFFAFLKFWIAQGIMVFIVMMAPLMGYLQNNTIISIVSAVGVFVFTSGLSIEATADAQKFSFTSNMRNKGHWIDEGVWRMSRHPNYLGEMLVWIGMYLTVMSSLSGVMLITALISPLFIVGMLLFVSGIPILEKSANKNWGDDKNYRKYKSDVPVLIPTPRSISRLFN